MSGSGRSSPEIGTRAKGKSAVKPGKGGSPLLQLVGLLLLGTGALIVWVGGQTIQASRDVSVRSGLDYEDFLEAVDDLLAGVGDSTLLRFDEVEASLSRRRTVTFDTITILADVEEFPAFDRGGFLFDQVRAYNRFQRERLDLGRSEAAWWDRLKAFNPSIFRPFQKPDGSRGLTRAPAAWSLRVRSPLEGDWTGEVLAKDFFRGRGLMSPRVNLPLRKPASLLLPVDGRRQLCEFVPALPEVRVYCLSEERIAQATLRLSSGARDPSWARAGWADMWVDGRRVVSGDSLEIQEGSVLRMAPMEPVVFGDYWEGVLSSKQWVNGRMRRRSDLPPPLDLFAGLGTGSAGPEERVSPDASVKLSVRAEASLELTEILAAYLRSEVDLPLDFGTMVLARIPDGEIVAVAEVGDRRNRGRSSLLERVAPGSAVKPLLAAAILSQRPELSSLETAARSASVSTVLGMPPVGARRRFTTTLNCAPPREGKVNLRFFLRCSNNEYAASLLVAGLVDGGIPGSTWKGSSEIPLVGTQVPRTTLLRSPLSEGLSELFDVPTDPAIADARRRSRRVWDGMTFSDGTPLQLPYELLPSESRPALLAPGSPEGTDLSLLYRYAYGAWENQWTLLDLTTGFARVVTDRRVRLTFLPATSTGSSATPHGSSTPPHGSPATSTGPSTQSDFAGGGNRLGLAAHDWYPEFLAGLRAVGVDGTARGLRSAWREAGLPRSVLSKTGTLNEAGEPTPTDDLFAKSLLFAVGESEEASGDQLSCGLVGGLYLRFSQGPRTGNLPSYQVEFAKHHLGELLQKYWEEFGACPGDGEQESQGGS